MKPLTPRTASLLRLAALGLSAAGPLIALVLDNVTIANPAVNQYRNLVRLAFGIALAGLLAASFWLVTSPKPRRLRWLWLLTVGAVFLYATTELARRGL